MLIVILMLYLIAQIAYVKSHTRELCSKQGRDLLTSISYQHPFVLTNLLQITMTTMSHIGVVRLRVLFERNNLYFIRELVM